MRIGGLASGIDTDSIIQDLMRAERIPLDKMEQDRQMLEWERDAFREINTMLFELDEMAFDLKLQRNFNAKTFHSSQENAVTARGGATSGDGTYRMDVERLATAAMNYSTEGKQVQNLDDPIPDNYIGTTHTFHTFNEDGEALTHTFEINEGDTLRDVIQRINDDDNNMRLLYDETTSRVIMEAERTGQYNPGNVSGEHINFAEGNKPENFPASFQEDIQDNEIIFDSTMNSFFTDVLHLNPAEEKKAQNAKIIYNGNYEINNLKDNSYTLNDVTFEFHDVTAGNATISVQQDVDNTVSQITDFVEKYNEVIETVNEKLREERHRDYPPLTEAQREEMSEREIELWEERAQSGVLRGDSILSSALSSLRQNWYAIIDGDGAFTSLSQIGITTTENYMDGGKLEIDEEILRDALAEDAESVFNLFSNNSDGNSRGIINRLEDTLDHTIDRINRRAGNEFNTLENYSLGRRMKDVDNQIDAFENRLQRIEDRYWRQFGQMEQAISMMNQQSMMLMSQFMPQQ